MRSVELIEYVGAIRGKVLTLCQRNPHIYALCAWCRTWKVRSTGQGVIKLTDEEFERTRDPNAGVGHTCCLSCAKTLKEKVDQVCAIALEEQSGIEHDHATG